jgi:AmmeMemoRadiSam system protein A
MVTDLTAADRALLLGLARAAIAARLAGHEAPLPEAAGAVLYERAASFVSLHHGRELRGCIGELEARYPLLESVRRNALHAAFDDPRFAPLDADELPGLTIEISVLTPATPIPGPDAIVIGRHGVILEQHGHRAVFLPQVAPDQGWDVPTMLNHLAAKANLPRDAWRQGARLSTFAALVFGEGHA